MLKRSFNPDSLFEYIFENKKRLYFPDFYLPQYDFWIEIKGYETPKDKAKWNYFPLTLKVLKKCDIKKIKDDTFILV